jgi:hypothetical protein
VIWGSLRVIDDKYEGSNFCIHHSSSSLPLHEYDCKNKFKVITDNPLMEMGVDMNYENPLLELDGGVVPDCSIALGKNNKVWDLGEDSELELECGVQLGFDSGSLYEEYGYPPGRPPDMKCAKEETDEDCVGNEMILRGIIIPCYIRNWKVTWVCKLMMSVEDHFLVGIRYEFFILA